MNSIGNFTTDVRVSAISMNRSIRLAGLILAAATIGLTGCSASQDSVIGTWTQSGVFLEFREDGTYSLSTNIDGLESNPAQNGDYELDGNLLSYVTDEESRTCPGMRGTYEIAFISGGELNQTAIEDDCRDRIISTEAAVWIPYSP